LTVPSNITFEATSLDNNVVPIGNATAIDVQPVTITNNAPALFPFGNTTVVWTAKDAAGNTANVQQVVQVVDRSPPQLTIPQDLVTDATAFETPLVVGQATATGIIDHSPKITNNSTGIFSIGKTVIQWTATDKFGNEKTSDQTVTILACGKPSSDYNLIMGTNGNDVLTGSMVPNLIIGLGGNDIIHEGPAGDCVIVENGDNIIYAGNGTNTIYAGNGNNIIKGGSGNMMVTVGDGSNIIQGGSGQNVCNLGNPSKDTVVNCQAKLH
jgi:Ca2+-binding RTX toxin-like protein